ncbi:MAG: RDD family protein [Chloroflexi bacterium]|nr:RDD family protein [Chloroflexota bacterium]
MFCSQCGSKNADAAAFCASCGASLTEEARTAFVSSTSPAPSGLRMAGRGSKLGAKILDGLALFMMYILIAISFIADAPGAFALIFLLIGLGILVMQVVWLAKDGQTIGKKLVGIKIVLASTGQNGGFVPNVLLRAWLNALIYIVPMYGLIDILFIFRSDRRCIHDLIAGTAVVRT